MPPPPRRNGWGAAAAAQWLGRRFYQYTTRPPPVLAPRARTPYLSPMPLLAAARPLDDVARRFVIHSDFAPAGDQPQAIADLVAGIRQGERDQVLLGVTGSGKTFTMAHVIAETQRPALILAPNKTLAAQLYGEMRSFFPDNAV